MMSHQRELERTGADYIHTMLGDFGREDLVPEGTSVLDAALDANALFNVRDFPRTLPDGTIPKMESGKYKGQPVKRSTYYVTADGEQKLLADSVSPQFPLSNYQQLVDMADAMFPNSCTGFRAFDEAPVGHRILFTQEVSNPVDLGNGDTLVPNLMWISSLDTSWSEQAHGGTHRFFCANQISYGTVPILKVKRTTNHDQILATKALVLAESMGHFEEFVTTATSLKRIPVSNAECWKILKAVLPEPDEDASGQAKAKRERQVAGIRHYWHEEDDGPSGGTAWALFNAFQSFEYHKGSGAAGVTTDDQKAEVAMGDAPITDRALSALLELV